MIRALQPATSVLVVTSATRMVCGLSPLWLGVLLRSNTAHATKTCWSAESAQISLCAEPIVKHIIRCKTGGWEQRFTYGAKSSLRHTTPCLAHPSPPMYGGPIVLCCLLSYMPNAALFVACTETGGADAARPQRVYRLRYCTIVLAGHTCSPTVGSTASAVHADLLRCRSHCRLPSTLPPRCTVPRCAATHCEQNHCAVPASAVRVGGGSRQPTWNAFAQPSQHSSSPSPSHTLHLHRTTPVRRVS